ncbi:MAG: class III signal peptide-containing protein [Bdellovibrionota bacterium]
MIKKNKNLKKGQTSVEYILIVGLLVGIVMMFGTTFKSKIGGVVGTLFGNIDTGIDKLSK